MVEAGRVDALAVVESRRPADGLIGGQAVGIHVRSFRLENPVVPVRVEAIIRLLRDETLAVRARALGDAGLHGHKLAAVGAGEHLQVLVIRCRIRSEAHCEPFLLLTVASVLRAGPSAGAARLFYPTTVYS